MREVADLAGVAVSSVSRVVSGHPDVSPRMRTRVLEAVETLKYQPHFLAQSLRRGETFTVGFIAGDFSNPLIAEIASGIQTVLHAQGYSMLVMNSGRDSHQEASNIDFLSHRRVDGMIISLSNERKRETIEAVLNVTVPIVAVDRDLPPKLRSSAVISDHRAGVFAATRDLIDLGHSHIAIITGPLDVRPARERVAGVRQAAAGAGRHIEVDYRADSFSTVYGEAATDELMEQKERPTAIIAGGNQILVGCLRALHRRGIGVGRQISVITCDEVPLAELFEPPIAAVVRDNLAIGRAAAELLLERIRGSNEPRQVVVPTSYVRRPSVQAVAVTGSRDSSRAKTPRSRRR